VIGIVPRLPGGLPGPLPQGELLLWQGRPDWRSLARRAFHVRKVAAYFAFLLAWSAIDATYDGAPALAALEGALRLLPLAAAGLALLGLLAWLSARNAVYTITSRRVVLRIGIALPITLNIPFRIVAGAALRRHADGTGDIPLTLAGDDRAAFLVLWPHVRPWRVARPEPMLRAVPDAEAVARLLAAALGQAAGGEVAAARPQPAPRREAAPLDAAVA